MSATPASQREKIIQALMGLAGERPWEDISISDVAERAGLSLADFRDAFPSKGAVLGGFQRMIDRQVLEGTSNDLRDEPARDRLFDVLMRCLDALAPYKDAMRNIRDWARREPAAALALNGEMINSMRFMLEAAGIDSEGSLGNIKLQGLVLAWLRILDVWFSDDDPQLDRTMAALDKELDRGGRIVQRLEDVHRLSAPLRNLAGSLFTGASRARERTRERWDQRPRGEFDRPVDV
ncbi:MAG: TetR/AcrR family transcriptional regulator [Alphaproteobacteria bacterium]|nr:TetR/AcrR family transcriptional regulator [Alphaproteobacteria bacterium]